MTKLLTVFGASGQQGGSVIDSVMRDTRLAQQYRIRGITRNSSSSSSEALRRRGVEVVQADLDDKASLGPAVVGSDVVFVVTNTIFDDEAEERELSQGRAIVDEAVAAGVGLMIFSTLPSATKISNGKYAHVVHFDTKAEIEKYIRSVPIQAVFISMGSFMQNLNEGLAPRAMGDGTYAIANCFAPKTQFPLVDARDAGKWAAAALADPEKYLGKFIAAATGVYSIEEIAHIMSRVSGKLVRYEEVDEAVVRSYLPPNMTVLAADMVDMAHYFQDFGYFGPSMKELVDLGSTIPNQPLTTLEDFLTRDLIIKD